MKRLLYLGILMLLVLPMICAISFGSGIDVDITTEDFGPLIWMCEDRIVLDDGTEPGRISDDGEFLIERFNNYAFEGEQISWKVLVMDKNGVEKIEDVFVVVGDLDGGSTTRVIEREIEFCDSIDLASTNWVDSMNLPKFDPSLGDLISADLTISSFMNSDIELTNPIDQATGTFDVNFDGLINATFGTSQATTVLGLSKQTSLGPFESDMLNINGTNSSTESLSNLGDFTGAGMFNINVEASATTSNTGPGNLGTLVLTQASAEACVTYTYEDEILVPGGGDIEANCRRINWNWITSDDELCFKSSQTNWQCGENPDLPNSDGMIVYSSYGDTLDLEVYLEGLKPNTPYQLTLQGRDGNDGNNELGNNCDFPNAPATNLGFANAWECGFLSGGTGSEGFWNFDMNAVTNGDGEFSDDYTLVMPQGHYGIGPTHDFGFGFIVKEITNGDSANSGDYVPVLMETNGLDWTISDIESPVNPSCNARILEEELEEFDPEVMEYYECLFTVETPDSMYGDFFMGVEAIDLDGLSGTMDENEYWFLNPEIALDVDGFLEFIDVRPGTSSYSETFIIGNDADFGSGVMLDMFISGTDFYDSGSSGAKCPMTNQLSLDAFRYFATNGAYDSYMDLEVDTDDFDRNIDSEGYVNIDYGIGFNDPNPFYDNMEILQASKQGDYYMANTLSPGSEMTLTFKLDLPEPCNGDFDSGQIFFWGEAI